MRCLLASACLPMLFRAVEINGECYWDGGYLANPAISPLINECVSKDVIIVQVNPMNRPAVPNTAREILNRVNEISFNSSLVREMNGITTITRLLEEGRVKGDEFAPVNFHMIQAEADMSTLVTVSKFSGLGFPALAPPSGWRRRNAARSHFEAIGNNRRWID